MAVNLRGERLRAEPTAREYQKRIAQRSFSTIRNKGVKCSLVLRFEAAPAHNEKEEVDSTRN